MGSKETEIAEELGSEADHLVGTEKPNGARLEHSKEQREVHRG